jgi:hypothetical protein
MAHRQTRIFVPPNPPFDDASWAETLVGSVINPLVGQPGILDRFWFSRYTAPRNDSGDCDIGLIPEGFGIDNNYRSIGTHGLFRSLRFRYEMEDGALALFEQAAQEAIADSRCGISDFRDYPFLQDLGGDRFIGGDRTDLRRQERAHLIYRFLQSTCLVYIHCLVGPDEGGKYMLEICESDENPLGSIFESVHHLFCNITDVPLRILVSDRAVGTDWSAPSIRGSESRAFRVRF